MLCINYLPNLVRMIGNSYLVPPLPWVELLKVTCPGATAEAPMGETTVIQPHLFNFSLWASGPPGIAMLVSVSLEYIRLMTSVGFGGKFQREICQLYWHTPFLIGMDES